MKKRSGARAFVLVVALAVTASAGACPFLPDHQLLEERDVLIALPRDFAGFRAWPSFDVDGEGGDGHTAGVRTVFTSIDVVKDEGAGGAGGGAFFAVGSVIVKAGHDTDGEPLLHAMVKRGGGFNVEGARNWEWFELTEDDDGIYIDWRGEDAPSGECYGLLPGQECTQEASSCNACHAAAAGNDFVQSSALQLEALDASLLAP